MSLAAMIPMRWPFTSVRKGAYASFSSAPRPMIGRPPSALMRSVSVRPSGPKSIPWLLAMVTTSTPADSSAVSEACGVWNVKVFATGDPPVPTAVSTLTIARSALESNGVMADSSPVGFASAAGARFSKLASPAKAIVTGLPLPSGLGSVVVGASVVSATPDGPGTVVSSSGEPLDTLRSLVEHPPISTADPSNTTRIGVIRACRTMVRVSELTTRFGTLPDCG